MKVLVTGASGVFGREIIRRLHARGHDVVGTSRRRPADLAPGVAHVAADIRDRDEVIRAMQGCDAVAHCAWVVEAVHDPVAERAINVGGTENVLAAMERTGARRVVFASSSTAYGPRPGAAGVALPETERLRPDTDLPYACQKAEVEDLLAAAPVEAVAIRTAVVVGRHIDNRIRSHLASAAQVKIRGEDQTWQVVHADDVGRFFALACEGGPAGPVNLAAEGTFGVETMAAVLGRPLFEVSGDLVERAVQLLWDRQVLDISPAELRFTRHMPLLDTNRLRDVWEFECAWSGPEALADTRLATEGVRVIGPLEVTLPWRTRFVTEFPRGDAPAADGHPLVSAAPPGLAGEFDDPIDPRFPTYVSQNLSEVLPGPISPLSISIVAKGLRASGAAAGELIGLSGVVGNEFRNRVAAVHGNRLYVNATASILLARAAPGMDESAMQELHIGRTAGEIGVFGEELPPDEPVGGFGAKVRHAGGLVTRLVGIAVGNRIDNDELVRQTARLEALAAEPETLSDERLEALVSLASDLGAQGWVLAGRSAIFAGATTAALTRLAGEGVTIGTVGDQGELTSAAALSGVRRLAATAAADRALIELLQAGGAGLWDRVQASAPAFARQVESALVEFGHRGPAEAELERSTFADDPDFLLRTVAKALAAPAHHAPPAVPPPRWLRPLARFTAKVTAERERGRDRTIRLVYLTRRLVREQARRLVARGVLADPGDVYYLTVDQLFAPPADVADVVARRRAERDRLAALRMPGVFSGQWAPEATGERLEAGACIAGVAASPGVAKGRARIVTPETVDDLEPGEVLVANVTDVGYTPIFGHAAAVVTDIGGQMSHAAVVAREFGIPAVVDTLDATARLETGMLLEVDGTAGTVSVLD